MSHLAPLPVLLDLFVNAFTNDHADLVPTSITLPDSIVLTPDSKQEQRGVIELGFQDRLARMFVTVERDARIATGDPFWIFYGRPYNMIRASVSAEKQTDWLDDWVFCRGVLSFQGKQIAVRVTFFSNR